MKKAIQGFLDTLHTQTTTESKKREWLTYITENVHECFKIMKDDADFYAEVTENRLLTEAKTESILEFTESIECRAMLLEYKRTL